MALSLNPVSFSPAAFRLGNARPVDAPSEPATKDIGSVKTVLPVKERKPEPTTTPKQDTVEISKEGRKKFQEADQKLKDEPRADRASAEKEFINKVERDVKEREAFNARLESRARRSSIENSAEAISNKQNQSEPAKDAIPDAREPAKNNTDERTVEDRGEERKVQKNPPPERAAIEVARQETAQEPDETRRVEEFLKQASADAQLDSESNRVSTEEVVQELNAVRERVAEVIQETQEEGPSVADQFKRIMEETEASIEKIVSTAEEESVKADATASNVEGLTQDETKQILRNAQDLSIKNATAFTGVELNNEAFLFNPLAESRGEILEFISSSNTARTNANPVMGLRGQVDIRI